MTMEKAAKEFGLTRQSLNILAGLGVIHTILTEEDRAFLLPLSRIWKDKECLKESLRQIRSKARREKLVRELDLTKPERYVLNRYLNAKGRLSIQKVTGEVAYYYGVPENTARGMARRMRDRAYKAKSRRTLKEIPPGQAKNL